MIYRSWVLIYGNLLSKSSAPALHVLLLISFKIHRRKQTCWNILFIWSLALNFENIWSRGNLLVGITQLKMSTDTRPWHSAPCVLSSFAQKILQRDLPTNIGYQRIFITDKVSGKCRKKSTDDHFSIPQMVYIFVLKVTLLQHDCDCFYPQIHRTDIYDDFFPFCQ